MLKFLAVAEKTAKN